MKERMESIDDVLRFGELSIDYTEHPTFVNWNDEYEITDYTQQSGRTLNYIKLLKRVKEY